MSNKKRVTAARSKPTTKPANNLAKVYAAAARRRIATTTDDDPIEAVALSTLTVDQFVKALAETMVSANAAQSNQISSQIAQQVSKQISETISTSIGKNSSDLQSRAIVQSDVDVNSEERIRSSAAREDALIGYKSNVTDYLISTDAVNNQRNTNSALSRMIESSLNHYNTMLSDERIQKAGILGAQNRHTDIAVEKQWATSQKNLSDAIVADVVKGLNDDVKKK